jgi:putative membrane protein
MMADKARFAVLVMACLQIAFLILEMVLWDTNIGHEVAKQLGEPATQLPVWAANQGLYNGFLAAGLIWGVTHRNAAFGFELQVFFLLCILAAGLYGRPSSPTRRPGRSCSTD